ncbi:2-methylisocitrate lyase-like PEP mutase family enzyme [Maritalea mobilis]|uniref:2-methylisocitrate lyase-like PEP mutase family enzyme n=1 Tax=Maritalea mobilis TaxID=483324 RepID=A0A4R6VS93_9HYPH|nr:isocitrate lyase/phosphoenolpyruvate mutase family protein [Maritalea mobilis]TDQ66902.1 2-methylisocitrate lyase-like PEP mutase family enzyme [Maritalea mobilis]
MSQKHKAEQFRDLHHAEAPLVLYNVWDAMGAGSLAEAGAPAVGTSSWAIAKAHGFEDGEEMPLAFAAQIVHCIATHVDVPVTADFEAGYASDLRQLRASAEQFLRTGIVGVNFEDQIVGGDGLYSLEDQVNRIQTVRHVADDLGIALFINARTDIFMQAKPTDDLEHLGEQAVARAKIYQRAGADGFFVPNLDNEAMIATLCQEVDMPLNIMSLDPNMDIAKMAALGVRRISFGPKPILDAMADFRQRQIV